MFVLGFVMDFGISGVWLLIMTGFCTYWWVKIEIGFYYHGILLPEIILLFFEHVYYKKM